VCPYVLPILLLFSVFVFLPFVNKDEYIIITKFQHRDPVFSGLIRTMIQISLLHYLFLVQKLSSDHDSILEIRPQFLDIVVKN